MRAEGIAEFSAVSRDRLAVLQAYRGHSAEKSFNDFVAAGCPDNPIETAAITLWSEVR